MQWTIETCVDEIYRHKFTNTVGILADWFGTFGGVRGRDVLEFGCGEGTMALGMALQHAPQRMIGVEVLDVHETCLPLARRHLGLQALPDNLFLRQIQPGQSLSHFGKFDCIYSWSVFEHVDAELLPVALNSIAEVLKEDGAFFLQISPLYYSPEGSHLSPWIPEPWAHLAMQDRAYREALLSAPETPPELRAAWSVYIPLDASRQEERRALWDTYETLNKTTAKQLERVIRQAGLKIVRDYRTRTEAEPSEYLRETFDIDALMTEQIVWMIQHESAEDPSAG